MLSASSEKLLGEFDVLTARLEDLVGYRPAESQADGQNLPGVLADRDRLAAPMLGVDVDVARAVAIGPDAGERVLPGKAPVDAAVMGRVGNADGFGLDVDVDVEIGEDRPLERGQRTGHAQCASISLGTAPKNVFFHSALTAVFRPVFMR